MNNRTFAAVCAAAALAAGLVNFANAASTPSLVADPGRPAADVARDADRKPAETLAFARVKAGQTIMEIAPGGGYFTRLLSKAVGPKGHIYAVSPPQMAKAVTDIAADLAYANVSVVGFDEAAGPSVPPVDLVFTAQNYHDLHLTRTHLDVPKIDKEWFAKLKHGGHLVIIDHIAVAGAPVTPTADAVHRIDPAFVRKEVEAAGFVFEAEGKFVRHPADDHGLPVFDPSVRGKTDQFAFRFKKP